MKIRAILPWMALAGLSLAPAAMAQAGSAAAPTKFKVMDMRSAIVSTAEAQAAGLQLKSQFAPQQAAIDGITKQMEDIQKRGAAGANTLSQDEQAKMQRQYGLLCIPTDPRSFRSKEAREELEDVLGYLAIAWLKDAATEATR